MNTTKCGICQKPNPKFECGICKTAICKNCAQFVEAGQFSFLATVPLELSHNAYCGSCFDEKVGPELAHYNELLEKAGQVFVFYKTQNKETRSLRRNEDPIHINDCDDKDETLLRLAFRAAQEGFNTLIDVVITSHKKIDSDGYQKSVWQGVGVPTLLNEKHPLLLRNE